MIWTFAAFELRNTGPDMIWTRNQQSYMQPLRHRVLAEDSVFSCNQTLNIFHSDMFKFDYMEIHRSKIGKVHFSHQGIFTL